MDLGLSGKIALVTGSTRGIGYATAQLLLEEGASVIINGTGQAGVDSALASLRSQGDKIAGAVADLSTPEGVAGLFDDVERRFDHLDILINNAGILHPPVPLMELEDGPWDEMVRVNLQSIHRVSRRAFRLMQSLPQGGVILNAASFGAVVPSAGAGLYGATKAAILNMSRTMAAELAPWNIRVNAYMPGVIATDMTVPALARRKEEMLSQIALRRLGTAREVAAPLVFLASAQASYITGAALDISGGKLAVQNSGEAWSWSER